MMRYVKDPNIKLCITILECDLMKNLHQITIDDF